jgi:O-antigen ligase
VLTATANKSSTDRIYFFCLLATIVLLPWSLKLCTFAIIAMCVSGLFTTTWNDKWQKLKSNKPLLIFPLLYVLFIVGLFYTPDLDEGLFGLEKKLALLAIPLIVGSSTPIDEPKVGQVMMAFVYSNLIFSIVHLIIDTYFVLSGQPFMNINFDVHTMERFNESFRDANPAWMQFSYIALGTTNLGPTYQSLFSVFCIIILYFSDTRVSPVLKWVMIAWFILIIILTASRTGFILLIIVTSLAILYKERLTLKGFVRLIAFLILVFLGSLISPVAKFRLYVEPSITQFYPENPDRWNSISLRLMEWTSGINGIKKYWPLGTGTGGTMTALRSEYDKLNLGVFKYDYTSHNQYIETSLEIGIVGLVVLIACYFIPMRMAILQKNKLLFSVILIMVLTSFTTCVLERSRGIIFYMSFASMLMIKKN